MARLEDENKQPYTKKDLKDPIEKSNHNCKGCEYENKCPYRDRSDCFQFNS
jgi:Rad3-related DNA helicase